LVPGPANALKKLSIIAFSITTFKAIQHYEFSMTKIKPDTQYDDSVVILSVSS